MQSPDSELIRRKFISNALVVGLVTGVTGCLSPSNSGSADENRAIPEPESPPSGIENGGLNTADVRKQTEDAIRERHFEFDAFLNMTDGDKIESSAISVRANPESETGRYVLGTDMENEITDHARSARRVTDNYYHNGTEYSYIHEDGRFGTYREQSYEDFTSRVIEDFTLYYNIGEHIDFGPPEWESGAGSYVITGEEIDDSSLDIDLEMKEFELHTNKNGIIVQISSEFAVNSEITANFDVNGRIVDHIDIARPDWLPEDIETEIIVVDLHDLTWKFAYDSGVTVEDHLRLPAGKTVHIEVKPQDQEHLMGIGGLRFKLDIRPGESASETIFPSPEQIGTYHGHCNVVHEGEHPFDVTVMEANEFDSWKEEG